VALDAYIAQVQSLLNDFGAVEYTTANLTIYINDARVQVAGASESIRFIGQATLALGAQTLGLGAIGIASAPSGTEGAISVRKGNVFTAANGWQEIVNLEWERFFSFWLNGPNATATGTPQVFSQLMPGIGGQIWLSPIPSAALSGQFDCAGYPEALASDTTPEALPQPWTESVQYYAAYLALLNAQRYADADSMLARYDLFQTRATQMTTPTALPGQHPGYGGAARAGAARPITAPPPGAPGRG
jgi:hypothetical protein